MDFEQKIKYLLSEIRQIKVLYSLGFLQEKEFYKIKHRILDDMNKKIEKEQIDCEKEINKL